MSLYQRRDVLRKLAALFGTTPFAGISFGDGDEAVLTGVVDRIADDLAVVLLEDDGDPVKQTEIAVEKLPPSGREEGAVLELVMDGDDVDRVRYDSTATSRRRNETDDRFVELTD